MNEEFYAILKLVSGEELFSKVCAFEEDGKVLVVLDNPIFVETTYSQKLGVPIARVNPWINLSEENTHIINRDKIITMNESHNKTLIKMHRRYVREQTKSTNQTNISPNMGYLSSIADARVSLEKIYNSSTSNQNNH